VGEVFLHSDRLGDWADWEHRFDEEIDDLDSARRCIDLMLESLDEAYTRRLTDEEVVERKRLREDTDGAVFSRRLPDGIGYMRILGFDADSIVDQVESELRKIADCDGFVIDLSGNGGGLLDETVNCLEWVLHEGPVAAVEYREGAGIRRLDTAFVDEAFVQLKIAPDKTEEWEKCKRRPPLIAGKPVVVIIDGGTASSAEIFAKALLFNGEEDGSVHSVGKRTYGKGIGQEILKYEDGTRIKVTSIRFFGADDRCFGDAGQSYWNGITPDEEVDGWNEQMTAAVAWLKTKLAAAVPLAVSRNA